MKKNNSKEVATSKVESLIIFRCNCRCIMCSTGLQIDRSQNNTNYHAIRPFSDIVKDIEKAKKIKARGFAFSGGEPTLRRDLPQLVKYAKKAGMQHIEVQSNGRMYSYGKYCEQLVKAGVNSFVISLHSHIEKNHDKIMGVKGTFKQAVAGIKNLNKLGQRVKINIVILKFNYEHLEGLVEFLNQFDIAEMRFTFGMIEGNVVKNPKAIITKMSKAAPFICKAIDKADKETTCLIYNMVPCVVRGHEKNINDLGQLDTMLVGPEFETSLDEARKSKKVKSPVCKKCKYDKICYGIWKNYAGLFGLSELKPVK